MKYLLLVYMREDAMGESERAGCRAETIEVARQLKTQGKYLSANPLEPVATATSVKVRDGQRVVTDGPFAETHEQLGGYFLIDARDLNEAIGIAARIPPARKGTVEIRPVQEMPGLPEEEPAGSQPVHV
jgi:hypothetical protein